MASSLFQQGIHGLELEDFVAGLSAMLKGEKPAISIEEAGNALEEFYKELEEEQNERAAAAGAVAKEEGEKFLAAAMTTRRPSPHEMRAFCCCMAWRAILSPLSKLHRRLDSF